MENEFVTFLNYCQVLFGSDWASLENALYFRRPAPATSAEIEAVRTLWSHYKLPPTYLNYLENLGRSSGRLRLFFDAPDNVQDLLAYVERSRANEQTFAPPQCVVLTAPGLSGGRGLLYETPQSEPRVVTVQWDEVVSVDSSSFTNFLFQRVWMRRWFLESRPVSARMPSEHGQEQVIEWLGQSSFVRANLPLASAAHDPLWHGYERGSVRLLLDQQDGTLFVHTASEDPDAMLDVLQSFQQAFGLRDLRP